MLSPATGRSIHGVEAHLAALAPAPIPMRVFQSQSNLTTMMMIIKLSTLLGLRLVLTIVSLLLMMDQSGAGAIIHMGNWDLMERMYWCPIKWTS